jgi:hypothetical protein
MPPEMLSKAIRAIKVLQQLGPQQASQYAIYQLGMRSGSIQRRTLSRPYGSWVIDTARWTDFPDPDYLLKILGSESETLTQQAGEILKGQITIFGQVKTTLEAVPPASLRHWARFEGAKVNGRDIKFTWEPARFGWIFPLARAYHLTRDEAIPTVFWQFIEQFLATNPPNLGPQWASAQEVALRLIAMTFAGVHFGAGAESNSRRMKMLGGAIAAHATRIPPTLSYARAQNNNHLLSEAAGLYTAGIFLPQHPDAAYWRETGWTWLQRGFQSQIAPDGTYMQHSTNYHRLMLQLALWTRRMAGLVGESFPDRTLARLAAATEWLLARTDADNGRVPNLGPNDGAYIFPLSVCPFDDFRPVVQAAYQAFLGSRAYPPGPWDEMELWFRVGGPREGLHYLKERVLPRGTGDRNRKRRQKSTARRPRQAALSSRAILNPATILRHPTLPSRAELRAATFRGRPGHADQLHVDLWWLGYNIARDPGTYHYNASPPWENSLASAFHHNTLTINGLDQMTSAGKFLYLDPAQARIVKASPSRISAEHDGYRRLDVLHRRELRIMESGWRISDSVFNPAAFERLSTEVFELRLHWLLPDWPWHSDAAGQIELEAPMGTIRLNVASDQLASANHQVIRAGQLLDGAGPVLETAGWYSPTYAVKEAALSFVVPFLTTLPFNLTSTWTLTAAALESSAAVAESADPSPL